MELRDLRFFCLTAELGSVTRAAETLCASYAAQYGVNARVARLCHVYGPTFTPSNSRADAQFLRKALAGEDIVMKSDYEGWMLVEAEQDPAKANPFEYAKKARAYIREKAHI